MMEPAISLTSKADVFLVLGTSMQVYPAASLIDFVPKAARKFLIDPQVPDFQLPREVKVIQEKATVGMRILEDLLVSS